VGFKSKAKGVGRIEWVAEYDKGGDIDKWEGGMKRVTEEVAPPALLD